MVALLLFGTATAARSQDEEPAKDDSAVEAPSGDEGAAVRHRITSEKEDESRRPRQADDGRITGPYGPAMDGVRGSGIAPAPGAFGTDAGSPSDLHR